MTTIALVHRLADADRALLARVVAALELLVTTDQPGLAPSGPLILVPHGAKVDYSMSSIPLGKDGIQALNAGDYDGPVKWTVEVGPATVRPEGDDSLRARVTLDDGAADGDTIEVAAVADIRHGEGTVNSQASFIYNVVAADAPPLTGAGFEVVDHAAEPA